MDGLILAASLVLLHEARNDRNAPGLARFMLMRQSGRCATPRTRNWRVPVAALERACGNPWVFPRTKAR